MTARIRYRLAAALLGAIAVWVPEARAELAGPYLAARSADMAGDYGEAQGYLARALVSDPSNIGLLEGLVMAHVGTGDVKGAVPIARRLGSLGGASQVSAIVLLADRLASDDHATVLEDLRNGGRIAGPLLDQMIGGWAELGAGSMAQAIQTFDKLSETPGLEVFGTYNKALALALAGDFEGADSLFSDPENGLMATRRAVFAHVQVLSQLDRSADALARLDETFGTATSDPELDALRAALAAGPLPFDTVRTVRDGMAEAFHLLAAVLQGEAPDRQTLIHARIAEFLRPDLVDAKLLSASVLESMGQGELAVAAYSAVPAGNPAFLAAASGKAQALYRLGRKAEALEAMVALRDQYARYLSVHVALGDMLRREERFAEAAEAYGRGIDLIGTPEQRHWGLFYARGIAWERAKDWDKAEADFRKALVLQPDHPQVLNYLGYSLLDMNRKIDEALAMVEKAVAQRPEDGHIVDSLAWGLFLTGRYAEAVEHMEKASLLMPVDPIVTDHLGDVYWAVGRKREAQFQWRRALSFEPEDKDATRIRRKLQIGLDAVLAEEGLPALSERGRK